MLIDNYREIERRVAEACGRCGRDPSEVTVIAVSKTKPLEMIEELRAAGVKDFGENYVQELADKADTVSGPVTWHFIGHLQRNKVKYTVGRAALIHSVDSVRLAAEISREAVKRGIVVPVLLEVNIGGEESKTGAPVNELEELFTEAVGMPGIDVRGLMTIAPPAEQPEDNRPYFKQMRQILESLNDIKPEREPMTELSMGMTGDFEVAVEEGATMIRVGTAIFGARVKATP